MANDITAAIQIAILSNQQQTTMSILSMQAVKMCPVMMKWLTLKRLKIFIQAINRHIEVPGMIQNEAKYSQSVE